MRLPAGFDDPTPRQSQFFRRTAHILHPPRPTVTAAAANPHPPIHNPKSPLPTSQPPPFVHNGEYEVVCAPPGAWIQRRLRSRFTAADSAVVEEIVAKCNGDIVTRGDLDRSRRELIETLRASGVVGDDLEKQLAEREKNLLRDRIDQLILAQKAKDLNINVDGDVSKQLSCHPVRFQDSRPGKVPGVYQGTKRHVL